MISKWRYHDLTKTDTVVTKISQVISSAVYSAVVSVCFLVWHLDYTLVHPLPVRVIKASLTITAWVQSRCKHPYRLLPSPSWIMVTHSDLGNEFPFRYRDLGVHKFAPVAATKLEMDWMECREKRLLNMLRLFNRITTMNPEKLPKIVYDWDRSLGLESWGSEIRHISASLGIDINSNDGDIFSLTDAYNIFLNQNRAIWQSEAHRKPKLRTFVQLHDFDSNQLLVKSGLTRYQRSLLSQLKFGILPLKIETDRGPSQ